VLLEESPESTSDCAFASTGSTARSAITKSKNIIRRIFISRFSVVNPSLVDPSLVDPRPGVDANKGHCVSDGKWASSMVALTRNLNFLGSRFPTGLAAVFVARLRHAAAWQVGTLVWFIGRHHLCSP
jgi:hypothetical protein